MIVVSHKTKTNDSEKYSDSLLTNWEIYKGNAL